MISTTQLKMSVLGGQKPLETDLLTDLTPEHTVEQALEHYRAERGIAANGERWTAFSRRGVKLDNKHRLADVPDADNEWTVIPEISAGHGNGGLSGHQRGRSRSGAGANRPERTCDHPCGM